MLLQLVSHSLSSDWFRRPKIQRNIFFHINETIFTAVCTKFEPTVGTNVI